MLFFKQKVIITGDNWKTVLLKYIDVDCLPVHWGGTLKDENGDEMCRSRIVVPSQKIPHELYWKLSDSVPPVDKLDTTSVGAGMQ